MKFWNWEILLQNIIMEGLFVIRFVVIVISYTGLELPVPVAARSKA